MKPFVDLYFLLSDLIEDNGFNYAHNTNYAVLAMGGRKFSRTKSISQLIDAPYHKVKSKDFTRFHLRILDENGISNPLAQYTFVLHFRRVGS